MAPVRCEASGPELRVGGLAGPWWVASEVPEGKSQLYVELESSVESQPLVSMVQHLPCGRYFTYIPSNSCCSAAARLILLPPFYIGGRQAQGGQGMCSWSCSQQVQSQVCLGLSPLLWDWWMCHALELLGIDPSPSVRGVWARLQRAARVAWDVSTWPLLTQRSALGCQWRGVSCVRLNALKCTALSWSVCWGWGGRGCRHSQLWERSFLINRVSEGWWTL